MAITSKLIGNLYTPGYGFYNTSPKTYELPRFSLGFSLMSVRWEGRDEVSYDFINKTTNKVLEEVRFTASAYTTEIPGENLKTLAPDGVLIRVNNSTPIYMFIIPNTNKTPPVWKG